MAKTQQPSGPNRPPPFFGRPGYRPRTSLLFMAGACLFSAWLLKNLEPTIDWQDIMRFMGVKDQDGYSRLAVLGLVLVGALVVLRIYRED